MNSFRGDVEHFYGSTHPFVLQLRRQQPRDYGDFIDALYTDLEELIGLMEGDAKDFMGSDEDVLNRELVRLLKAKCYTASHDHDEGGHVDVHVRSGDGRFSWLAEAKIDRGPAYLLKGVDQLTDRYARGTPGHNCGALLIYIQQEKISERIATWRSKFADAHGCDVKSLPDCTLRPGLAFYSDIVLPRIGANAPAYRIRHIGISLYRVASAS